MTPEEKAESIFTHYCDALNHAEFPSIKVVRTAKRCALIAVEEIMSAIKVFHNGADWQLYETMGWQYWTLVKKQIELL